MGRGRRRRRRRSKGPRPAKRQEQQPIQEWDEADTDPKSWKPAAYMAEKLYNKDLPDQTIIERLQAAFVGMSLERAQWFLQWAKI